MSIQLAEELRREWTDKYVAVHDHIPELRRFQGLTGRVRTVNMNCRLLVEFDAAADISWYDIDPAFVSVTDPPDPIGSTEQGSNNSDKVDKTYAQNSPAPAAAGAVASSKGTSPLDQIRQQTSAATTTPATSSDAPNPLDVIRAQSKASSPAVAPAADNIHSISPLEAIRRQNAGTTTGNSAPKKSAPIDQQQNNEQDQSISETVQQTPTETDETTSATAPAFLQHSSFKPATFSGQESGDLIRQIRRQAGVSESSELPNLFQQVRAQAESDSDATTS